MKKLEPNEQRHKVRAILAERRRECYKLTYHVKALRERGKEPSEDKLVKLRALRKECKLLSRELRRQPPLVVIKTGEGLWLGKHFKRFRHSARATRWIKRAWTWARK